MLHIKRVFLVLCLLVAAAGGGYWWWKSTGQKEARNEQTLYGNVDIRKVEMAFNGSERIAEMLVWEGDRVKQGQLVARLETDRLQQAVAQAEAQVRAQQQLVARMLAGSRPQEISRARAEMKAAEAEAVNAVRLYERRRPLVQKDAVSKEQTDNAKTSAEAAQERLKAAREAYSLVVEGPRREDIESAKATLDAYRATLALQKRMLVDAFLYAPADGVIQTRNVEPGDMTSPLKTVYTLALTDPMWVRAYVDESELGKLQMGMSAGIETDSYPGKIYHGWIGYISPTAEFTPKTVETAELRTKLVYQVRVYVCDAENQLRQGMPATVTIPLDQTPVDKPGWPERCKKP